MRYWLLVGLMVSAVACSGSDDTSGDAQNGDSDGKGDTDAPYDGPATCNGLYDYVDGCFSDAGCAGAFVEDNLVDQCESIELTASEIRERYAEGCTESVRFFCTLAVIAENNEFFGLQCCQDVYACPAGQVCEPLEDAGVCVTADSAFPAGAPTCSASRGCNLGYKCVQGESSSKCVQICVPE